MPTACLSRPSPLSARTLLYSLSLCWAEVIADSTDSLFTRLLMLEAVPYSSPSIFVTRATCTRVMQKKGHGYLSLR